MEQAEKILHREQINDLLREWQLYADYLTERWVSNWSPWHENGFVWLLTWGDQQTGWFTCQSVSHNSWPGE